MAGGQQHDLTAALAVCLNLPALPLLALQTLGQPFNASASQLAAAGIGPQELGQALAGLRGQVRLLSSRDHIRALTAGMYVVWTAEQEMGHGQVRIALAASRSRWFTGSNKCEGGLVGRKFVKWVHFRHCCRCHCEQHWRGLLCFA
jgi:hypothetical protein